LFSAGLCFTDGHGTEPNPVKGVAYFERAIALGNTEALGALSLCYMHGAGVRQSNRKTAEYFIAAAELGTEDESNGARKFLAQMLANGLI
jgi:hypothetical protein